MSDGSFYNFTDDTENMPCILRGNKCPQYDRCAAQRLACRAYADYIYYGRAKGRRGNPTRAQFLEAEKKEAVGPMLKKETGVWHDSETG